MKELLRNVPPAKTFGWLGVNGTRTEAPEREKETALTLAAGETRTVVEWQEEPALRLTAELGEGALLRLVQIRRGGGALANSVAVTCGAGARFEWYRVILGGEATYDDCSVALSGAGSSFAAELGYRLTGEEKLDSNCVAVHTGKKTRSEIHARGVLSERAFKLFRGTIDLQPGCAGAKGSETENVLLMDETVRNQTLPVILCGEEDVEGDHGATIGRPDEEAVYYLESRGLDREQAYALLAKGQLEAVIRRIPDQETVAALLPEEEEEAP